MAKRIGVISDTHGLLRDEAVGRLQGCDLIIHAGDVGSPSILEELGRIAPLVAVRGNVDTGVWAAELPPMEYVQVEDATICVIHNIAELELDPAAAGVNVVVYGHSHKPAADWKTGVLYLNPGSIGPRRFHLPVSMAYLHIQPQGITPEFVTLDRDLL
jgi:putative phosphoesterase